MIGWWEASWANVIVTGVLALVAITVLWAALEELPLRRAVPHQPPAGGEDPPAIPPSGGGSLLPGSPPPPLRRLIYREDRLACGCTYVYDLEAAVMARTTCDVCAFDPDAWNQRLTQ